MASLTLFGYVPGSSVAHRLEIRCKLFAYLVLSGLLMGGPPLLLPVAAAGLLAAYRVARISVRGFLAQVRPLLLILALLVISRALPAMEAAESDGAALLAGALDGLAEAGRLLALVGLSNLLIATTRLGDMEAVLSGLGRNGRTLGTLLRLTLSLVPRLFGTAGVVREAMAVRRTRRKTSPLRELLTFARTFLFRTVDTLDSLVEALEIRSPVGETSRRGMRAPRFGEVVGVAVLSCGGVFLAYVL